MLSAFLSPIGESPIDPEEADEELDADQVYNCGRNTMNIGKRKWKENTK
jgi:hypothetical protein